MKENIILSDVYSKLTDMDKRLKGFEEKTGNEFKCIVKNHDAQNKQLDK